MTFDLFSIALFSLKKNKLPGEITYWMTSDLFACATLSGCILFDSELDMQAFITDRNRKNLLKSHSSMVKWVSWTNGVRTVLARGENKSHDCV